MGAALPRLETAGARVGASGMLLVDPAGAPTQAAKVPSVAIAANMARRILVRWLRGGTVTGILEWVKSGVGFRARLHLTDH